MQQLELVFDTSVLPDICPDCRFGERVDFAGDDYHSAGYFYVCDCGYSVGMEPTITFQQFESHIDDLRLQLRALIADIEGVDLSIDKVSAFISDRVAARVRKMQDKQGHPFIESRDFMADGRDWKNIAPKSDAKRRELRHSKDELEYQANCLRRDIFALRDKYPTYAYQYDFR